MEHNSDFEPLLGMLYDIAQKMLIKNGEFYPFGATIDKNGSVAIVAGSSGDEHPQSNDEIELIRGGFRSRAERGEIRAAGICLDVRVIPPNQTEKSDAICAWMEHENGEAAEVYLPYHKDMSGFIKYGDIFAYKGSCKIFR